VKQINGMKQPEQLAGRRLAAHAVSSQLETERLAVACKHAHTTWQYSFSSIA